ncbi:IclR family transcriptional regulator [Oryzibacter oryziterrae]|uniref:IclR family transcriptional regulator n=1 Tax=Oryzibacter oryziterrae TaxID=2766474 RepID=UPI001F1F806B|nr:IclR family transcriptional regulator [Oryzibacter oryziterrae]
MSELPPGDKYRAPALDKGLDILELLAAVEGGLTQAEIARHLGRSPNEFYRMLDRLVRRGYVARSADDRYQLTLRLFALSHLHPPVRRMVAFATPQMREFAEAAQQSIHLAVYDRGSVVVIAQIAAPGYWGLGIRIGARIGLTNTGSGHVLLAFCTPAERALMLAEYEPVSDESLEDEDFLRRLADIRERGYELQPSLQTANVQNISVPLLGPDGKVLAALTCPYILPHPSVQAPSSSQALDLLRKAAGTIIEQMGTGPQDGSA